MDSTRHIERIDALWSELTLEHVLSSEHCGSDDDRDTKNDGEEHLSLSGAVRRCRVCIDVDTSFRALNDCVVLGCHRSGVHSRERHVLPLLYSILRSDHVDLSGLLFYEAHIAGLADSNPRAPTVLMRQGWLIRPLQALFDAYCVRQRRDIVDCVRRVIELERCADRLDLSFVNCGGTGNVVSLCQRPETGVVTDVAIGSGLMFPHLFDCYSALREVALTPALCFALPIARVSPAYVVCQGGGFIASGPPSSDKEPLPFILPRGVPPTRVTAFADEGYGEVQTPLCVANTHAFDVGNPLFFRPSKAGEIAERFNDYIVIARSMDDGKWIVKRFVKTYRGFGHAFY